MTGQQRGEETRSNILEAALDCFAQRGYAATGVAEICKRAGVTKGAFYYHFPSKQAIFLELFNHWLEGIDRQLTEARSEATNVSEGLLRMASKAQSVFETAGGQLPLFLEFWTEAQHDPAIRKVILAPYRRYRDFFADIVKAGVAEGSLRPVDPDTAAQVIVSLAAGLVLQGVLDSRGADWGKVVRDAVQVLLEGLKKQD